MRERRLPDPALEGIGLSELGDRFFVQALSRVGLSQELVSICERRLNLERSLQLVNRLVVPFGQVVGVSEGDMDDG